MTPLGILFRIFLRMEKLFYSESEYNEDKIDIKYPEDNEGPRKRQRKTFVARDNDFASYHKQPKIFTEQMLELRYLTKARSENI